MLTSAMGTGKSACALNMVDRLYPESSPSVLIVCGLRKAVPTWRREIPSWLPDHPFLLYRGTPYQRRHMADQVRQPGMWVVTTSGMIEEILDIKKKWDVLIVDEGHVFANRKTKTFGFLKKLVFKHLCWITGTAMINGPQDLWTALNLIDAKKHSSYWRYLSEVCYVEFNGYGQQIIGPKDPIATKRMLSDYLYQIDDEVAKAQMPPKRHLALPVEMSPYQAKAYEELAEELLTSMETQDSDYYPRNGNNEVLVLAPNKLAVQTRLRQLLITPALLGGKNSESVGLEMIRDRIDESRESCVIFTPYRKAFPFIDEWLKPLGPTIEHIHGRLTDKQFDDVQDRFHRAQGLKVLISTIRSAASWEVPEIQTGYFIGYDWTPAYNLQAEDRLHRLTSVGPITLWYISHFGTIDEHIMDILDHKVDWYKIIPRRLLLPSAV